MHFLALPVWVLLGVFCLNWYPVQQPAAPESKKPNRSQFEQKAILYQPFLHWADGTKTHQGTGFFAKTASNQVVAVTCVHLIDFDGPELVKAEWLDLATDKSVATMTRCWGTPGSEGTDEPLDIRFDYLIMPTTEPVDPSLLLELDNRAKPNFGERVWFPNKGAATKTGFEMIEGTIVEVEAGYVLVLLDKKVKTESQSGTPIISQDTGKVVGLFAKSGEADGKTAVGLTPIPEVLKAFNKNQATPFLKEVTGKNRPPAPKPDLTAGWEKYQPGNTGLTVLLPHPPQEVPVGPDLTMLGVTKMQGYMSKSPDILIFLTYVEFKTTGDPITFGNGVLHGIKKTSKFFKNESKAKLLPSGQVEIGCQMGDGTVELQMKARIWPQGTKTWMVMTLLPQQNESSNQLVQQIIDSVQIETKPVPIK